MRGGDPDPDRGAFSHLVFLRGHPWHTLSSGDKRGKGGKALKGGPYSSFSWARGSPSHKDQLRDVRRGRKDGKRGEKSIVDKALRKGGE